MKQVAIAILTLAVVLTTVSEAKPQRERKAVLSAFCQFSISAQLMQTNLSFGEVYTFTLDEHGKAFGIKRVSGDYLNKDEVSACINRWEFSGFEPKSRVNVSFTWKHGVGWTEMKVISKDFAQNHTAE